MYKVMFQPIHSSKQIVLEQFNNYYDAKNYYYNIHKVDGTYWIDFVDILKI